MVCCFGGLLIVVWLFGCFVCCFCWLGILPGFVVIDSSLLLSSLFVSVFTVLLCLFMICFLVTLVVCLLLVLVCCLVAICAVCVLRLCFDVLFCGYG